MEKDSEIQLWGASMCSASLTNHASKTEWSIEDEMPAKNLPASRTSYCSLRTIRLCTMNTKAHTMEPRFLVESHSGGREEHNARLT